MMNSGDHQDLSDSSSSSKDSNIEELLHDDDDDCEVALLLLAVKEHEDRWKLMDRRHDSVKGRTYIQRNCFLGHATMMHDYFAEEHSLVEKLVEDAKDAFEGLEITRGHMVLELRPPTGLNKGTAVNYLINYILGKLGLDETEVLPIYFGDDVTDEDAFEVLREKKLGFGVLISQAPRSSKALYSLKNPLEVMRFLNELVGWRKSLEALSATAENEDEIVETSSR